MHKMSKVFIVCSLLSLLTVVVAQEGYESFNLSSNPSYLSIMQEYDKASDKLSMLDHRISGNNNAEEVYWLKTFKAEYYRDVGDVSKAMSIFDEIIATDTNALHVYYSVRQKGVYYAYEGNSTGVVQCALMGLQLAPNDGETWRILYAIKYNNEMRQYDNMVSDYSLQKLIGTTNVLMAERFLGLVTTNNYAQPQLRWLYQTVISNLVTDATNSFVVKLQGELEKMQ